MLVQCFRTLCVSRQLRRTGALSDKGDPEKGIFQLL